MTRTVVIGSGLAAFGAAAFILYLAKQSDQQIWLLPQLSLSLAVCRILGLAPLIVADIFRTIGELRQAGVSVLLVEQNASAALEIADRGYVLETGKVAFEGAGATLLSDPKVKAAYLGVA